MYIKSSGTSSKEKLKQGGWIGNLGVGALSSQGKPDIESIILAET